jgi:hypothetical protein
MLPFKTRKLLPTAHAETLYFILGFVLKALANEGVHRKSKGALFRNSKQLPHA